jgi:hypothetical protein
VLLAKTLDDPRAAPQTVTIGAMNPSTQQAAERPERPSEPRPAGERSRPRALMITAIAVAVAGVFIAVAWVTGGLRSQSATRPPQARPGATIDQGRFTVQVIGAHIETAKIGFSDKPIPALVVRMRVNNTGKDTVLMHNSIFGFSAGVLLEPGWRQADDARNDPAKGAVITLQPRLPRDIDLMWKWQGAPPAQVTLGLHEWIYRLQFDHGGYYWDNGKHTPTVSDVTVPVRQGGV